VKERKSGNFRPPGGTKKTRGECEKKEKNKIKKKTTQGKEGKKKKSQGNGRLKKRKSRKALKKSGKRLPPESNDK